MQLPWAAPIQDNPLTSAMQIQSERQKQAADKLRLGLEQQRLGMDQSRAQAEEARARAMESRADSQDRREDRMADEQVRQNRLQGVSAVMPYLDPSSPQFNPQMAQQLAQAHGIPLSQGPEPQAPGPAPQLPSMPAAGPMPSPREATQAVTGGAAATPQIQAAGDQAGQQAAQEAMQVQQERDQYAQHLQEAPARQADYAKRIDEYQQRKQFPSFNLDLGQGQTMNVDTMALHQQAQQTRQQRAQLYQAQYGDDPESLKIALPMAMMGQPDDKIQAAVNSHRDKYEGLKEKWDLANKFQTTADQKFRIGMANAGAHQATAGAAVDAKADQAAARAQSLLERATEDAKKSVDWKGLQSMDTTMRSLLANATDPHALNHRDAQIQLAKVFRGTTPTEGEMHLLYDNLGGTADKLNQWAARLESGDMSALQLNQLKHSGDVANEELDKRKTRAFTSLKTALGPGSGYEMLGPQVNAHIKALGQAVGVDVPDLYEQAGATGNQGAAVLGSRAKNAAKKTGINPIQQAQTYAKLPPEDKQAVDWARKNKGNPAAAKILDLHGLQ